MIQDRTSGDPCFSVHNGSDIINKSTDAGQHYRYSYRRINLDPFRIAKIYDMKSFAMMTILKKCLCAGERGHKDYKQDLFDIISAAEREIEMMDEDG